jgi:hypothetical protein
LPRLGGTTNASKDFVYSVTSQSLLDEADQHFDFERLADEAYGASGGQQ